MEAVVPAAETSAGLRHLSGASPAGRDEDVRREVRQEIDWSVIVGSVLGRDRQLRPARPGPPSASAALRDDAPGPGPSGSAAASATGAAGDAATPIDVDAPPPSGPSRPQQPPADDVCPVCPEDDDADGGGGDDLDEGVPSAFRPQGVPEVRCPHFSLADPTVAVGCSRCLPTWAGPRGFGNADEARSFTRLATHLNSEFASHQLGADLFETECMDMGVYQCPIPGCGKWCATVGAKCGLYQHLFKCDRSYRGDAGDPRWKDGREGFMRLLQQQARPGSAAHYFRTVCYARKQPQADRRAKHARWVADTAKARSREEEGAEGDPEARRRARAASDAARKAAFRDRGSQHVISSPGALDSSHTRLEGPILARHAEEALQQVDPLWQYLLRC
ncbi:hypothetical protein EMIHUDRAFT_205810 [Emiliania huxleyi CCMP1516]|uniref:Uncharacterized protein n=2 Tax=Emiliania huxleyi TaxID=2903 RepID=A0A0D3JQD7_EMIH1|nr:hypothetical protein EMIHUDRAFT_205810 [Emiliania huxleyi CCMP1516]EOD25722.1 hypothetical protein EMIHUDRAFT_205810 [Emiliania huxleyi CCMP1516]|eukprot:XP_005778151.1 hypothetical protein EMIHUDRAFT_205810 [Emiliania huxleyi CCMP1516]